VTTIDTALKQALAAPPADEAEFALGVRKSFSGRPWRFRAFDPDTARAMELKGLSPQLARVLAARGVAADDAIAFLDPKLKNLMPDPNLLHDMEKAVARAAAALTAGEGIGILGDYDVDGGCASALLLCYFRQLGLDPPLYIPDRMSEGYGPSVAAIGSLAERNAKLVITVDCGAAAVAALEEAQRRALDVVVLDHHAVEKNPPALAHVNPNGPDDRSGLTYLAGTAVTFMFLVALTRHLRAHDWFATHAKTEPDLLGCLDLVALATITDVVPLTGVNRAFVRLGLKMLHGLERPGLKALADVASVKPPFSPYSLGFVFGPRINAGGRVGRCDLGALTLATADAAQAVEFAALLNKNNKERQTIEANILEEAEALAAQQADAPFVFVARDGWHAGVVGIVAGRLKERHRKPALVAGFDEGGAIARGSARSVPGVDLGAVIRAAYAEGLLEAGGGHAMAAGFTLARERIDAFREFLQAHIEPKRDAMVAANDLYMDAMVSPSGASTALVADLESAGPYGAGHPEAIFVVPDALVAYADIVGRNHVRLRLIGRDGNEMRAVSFRSANTPLGQALLKSRGKRIHAVGCLKRDDYNGEARVELHLEDAAAAGA
jgi:single-stranded-DNA-specific exonuclease